MSDPIKRIELRDGRVRYRFVIDIGRDADGRRQQKTFTFDRKRDAQQERARILHEVGRGVYVAPTGRTDQLRRVLYRLMSSAGVRQVRPYDARHACLTYLAANGVPDVVVSAWAGHADLSLAKRVYVHPDATHLQVAADRLDVLLNHN